MEPYRHLMELGVEPKIKMLDYDKFGSWSLNDLVTLQKEFPLMFEGKTLFPEVQEPFDPNL